MLFYFTCTNKGHDLIISIALNFLKETVIQVIEIMVAKIPEINILYQIHSTGLSKTKVKKSEVATLNK